MDAAQLVNDRLLLVSKSTLAIGSIDTANEMYTRSIQLGQYHPRRIVFLPDLKMYLVAVCCSKSGKTDLWSLRLYNEEFESVSLPNSSTSSSSALPDDTGLELFTFEINEHCQCLDVMLQPPYLTSNSNEEPDRKEQFVLVGTGYTVTSNVETRNGRLLALRITSDGQISIYAKDSVDGCVFSVKSLPNDCGLVCGINAQVHFVKWELATTEEAKFQFVALQRGFTMALFLSALNQNTFAVGDLMRSVSILKLNKEKNAFVVDCIDDSPCWMTALTHWDDDLLIGGDTDCNLHMFKRTKITPPPPSTTKIQHKLQIAHSIHTGEFINKIVTVSASSKSLGNNDKMIVFAGVHGSIVLMKQVKNAETYELLCKLQSLMETLLIGVGGLPHSAWNKCTTPNRRSLDLSTQEQQQHQMDIDNESGNNDLDSSSKHISNGGILDLTYLESFRDLPPEWRQKICNSLGVTANRLIEELGNLELYI